jgi:hypothetical protein
MSTRTIIALVLLVLLIAAAMLLSGQERGESAAQWPSTADEPPLEVPPLSPESQTWATLKTLLASISAEDGYQIMSSVMTEGPPLDPGFWAPIADELDALEPILEAPLVSPGATDINGVSLELPPLLALARGLSLRGWTSYESSMLTEAAADILAADRLGQQLVMGGQTVAVVMYGYLLQDEALTELTELLDLVDDSDVHALAAERLTQQATVPGRIRDVMLRECALFESMFSETSQGGQDYDADATVAQHRRNCRAVAAWLEEPPAVRGPLPDNLPPGVSQGTGHNALGVTMLNMVNPAYDRMIDREHATRLHRDGLQLLTAARRYAYDHDGTLPSSTEVLVPEYLPGPLSDPFQITPLAIQDGRITSGDPEQAWAVAMPTPE